MNKKIFKKLLIQSILITETFLFGFTYLFGKDGINLLTQSINENKTEKEKIQALKNELYCIEQQIKEWNLDSFYKEKIARENLLMSKKK